MHFTARLKYLTTAIWYGVKTKLIYRYSAWGVFVDHVCTFMIQIMIWQALLGNGARFDTTFAEMFTYVVITHIMNSLVRSFSGYRISSMIRSGDIAIHLVRPINFKIHTMLHDLGENLFSVVCVSVPVCVLLSLHFDFLWPADPWVTVLTLVMLINGMFMLFHYRYILGLISFWLIENPFTSWHFQNSEGIFSGQVVPIWLYPAWLAGITQFLPFRYFTYEPLAFFLGKTPFEQAGQIILIQLVWMAALYILERVLSARAMRKLIIQGG